MTLVTDTMGVVSPTHDTDGSVELDSVTKLYGAQKAVDNLSLRIEPGEFLSLLGPSGCGKTTTLRMIAGFEQPNGGDIRIGGTSVAGVPAHRRNVNTVFQAYALFPHMSIAENVAYGLQQRRVPKSEQRERVASALDMVRMRSFGDRKPTQLSGGQQQRIALARALVNRPSVLLLDEPLGALDRQLREEMQIELKILQADLGITFVFVTHDQGEALSMSDRIAIMRAGRIEQLADADTIYAHPASAYVAGFVGQQNFFDGTVSDHAASGMVAVSTEFGPILAPASFTAGTVVQAAIRPEFMRIEVGEQGAAPNRMRGHLISTSHLGETMQFVVSLGKDRTVLVRRPTLEAPRIEPNTVVTCSWDAQNTKVFTAPAPQPHSAVPDQEAS